MRNRKLIALLTLTLFLVGCGNATGASDESSVAIKNEKEVKTSESEQTKQNAETLENQFTLSASTEDKGVKSAIITFDAEKICISDQNRNATAYTYFDYIGDPNSTLFVRCYDTSVEELYNETKVKGFSKQMQEHITLTDITEITIGDLKVKRYDSLYKGELHEEHFIIELDNGYILHNGGGEGYDGNVSLEEMLACVFTNVETGDGTRIRPAWGFEKENDGSALKYTFDSGEIFTWDYAEDVVEMSTAGSVIDLKYLDEQISDNLYVEIYVSKKFDSFEAYKAAQEENGFIITGCEIKHQQVGDFDIFYACEEPGSTNWINGIWYMKLPDGFSIRGTYENCYDDMPISLPSAIAMTLGVDVELTEGNEEQESYEGKTLADITASYGYKVPTELGATIDTLTFSINDVLYQFPTPVSVFMQNGWRIPAVFKEKYDGINAGDSVSVALENDEKGIIYNVILKNMTLEDKITLEEGMVVCMQVAYDSKVYFELPEGISFNSSLDDLKSMPSADYVDNSPYSTFSWWNEDEGSGVSVWCHPESGIEYFEFIHY